MSNTLDTAFCIDCLKRVVHHAGIPEIINTDQGCQFTAGQWAEYLKKIGTRISMGGRGRWIDNVAIERFWRSIKYKDIYLKSYSTGREVAKGIKSYITRYNHIIGRIKLFQERLPKRFIVVRWQQ